MDGVAHFKILFKQSPEESKNNLKICHNSPNILESSILSKQWIAILMFIGPCIIAITEESKNQLDAT